MRLLTPVLLVVCAEMKSTSCRRSFYTEEMHGFRVRQLAPRALRVLDMQDFHSLRGAREAAARAGASAAEVLAAWPDASAPDCLRELASIHRSDLTLVCSPDEMRMLRERYCVPDSKLALAPLFYPPSPYDPANAGGAGALSSCPGFEKRRNVAMVGNWRHAPNMDSVHQALALWPAARAAIAAASPDEPPPELHLFGAYPPGSAAQQFHRPKEGIQFKGWAPSLDIMLQYRLLLAPLRFGAGLKGKVGDAWWHGLPVVTTPVGAEGMTDASGRGGATEAAAAAAAGAAAGAADPAAEGAAWHTSPPGGSGGSAVAWGGLISGSGSAEELAADAARLYTDPALWSACQAQGFRLLRASFDCDAALAAVRSALLPALGDLEQRRRADYYGQLLWQANARSTEFMSRYIELKEGLREQAGRT